ncbi:MAG: TolB family protein [Candidatus Xenobiia bacterium LiM19]
MNGRIRHRGFSLLELLLIMVVMAVAFAAVASGGGHAPKEKADSKALAESLAEELRLARQKAMTKEIPVGVIFPGDEIFPGRECKSPVMQSCYILEGETPKHTRTIDYSKAYPSTYIFIGFWDLASGHGSVTADQPSTGSNYDTFDVENWGEGTEFKDCRDFALIFTPAGTVRTNRLPNFDCDFHILVNRAVAYEVAALPTSAFDDGFMLCFLNPEQYFKLKSEKSVCDPYTINISVHGEITVTPGVTGLPAGSPAVTTDPFHVDPVPAPLAPPGTLNNPTIDTVDINPVPNAATLPSGADATVGKEQYVTFTVKASDANSDTLWCRWTAVKSRGTAGGTGGITPEEESRMEWNYSENKWNAVTEWRPPSDAAIGDRYTLTCTVSDRNGGTVTVSKVVEIVGGKIAYWQETGSTRELWIMNEDGTAEKKLYSFNGYSEGRPFFSPNGSMILFHAESGIYTLNMDGSGLNNVTSSTKWYRSPSFSPDGTKIAYEVQTPTAIEIWIKDLEESATPVLLAGGHSPAWSPDGKKIIFNDLETINVDGTGGVEKLIDEPEGSGMALYSPDGSKVVYQHDVSTSFPCNRQIRIINVNTKAIINITDGSSDDILPCWSPDGSKVAFYSNRDGGYSMFVYNLTDANIKKLNDKTYYTDSDGGMSWTL